MTTRSRSDAEIRQENEAYLMSEDGCHAMINWLVEHAPAEFQRERLASLPVLQLADVFADRQYFDEVSSRPMNEIDIPLLGRIASQYVASHAAQADRGRAGGARSKRKEGIWRAALYMARNPDVTTAREAFMNVLRRTNVPQPLQVDGWEITATMPGPRRHAEGRLFQRNLQTGETAGGIGFRSFETGYWPKARKITLRESGLL